MGKVRNERFREGTYQEWQGSASSTPPAPTPILASGNQELIYSVNNAPLNLGHHDDGSAFHCVRRELEETNFGPTHNRTVVSGSDSNSFAYNYKGSYFAKYDSINDSRFPVPSWPTNAELIVYGTTAIARCIPTNPLVDLLVALGELRSEGLPLIDQQTLRARTARARDAGADYLNVEFGWKPLVSDITKLVSVIEDSENLLKQYEKSSGKVIRRKYTFPTTTTSSTSSSSSGNDAYPTPAIKVGYWNSTGTLTTTVTTQRRTWFSGAFTYYLPSSRSIMGKEARIAKTLGLRITPEVLWNLTPWSWVADWFTNMGDVMHNVSAFINDGLVMPWGYIMCENTSRTLYTHTGARTKRFNANVGVKQQFTSTRKQRLQASPFGFGLLPTDLSERQWAILVALGLTRGTGQTRYM